MEKKNKIKEDLYNTKANQIYSQDKENNPCYKIQKIRINLIWKINQIIIYNLY